MAKTIIQTIGPLYGEVVNGTVFGRPNGSIFVPAQNTITLSLVEDTRYIRVDGTAYVSCASNGAVYRTNPAFQLHIVAESQDVANYVVIQVSKSSDFAVLEGSLTITAGLFNNYTPYLATGADLAPIVADDTYYIRAVLFASSGEAVATSEAIEMAGVVL